MKWPRVTRPKPQLLAARHDTLFAALDVDTGKIIATHSKRRRRLEYLDFMNGLTAAFPNRQLHVILDNLAPQEERGPAQGASPNVHYL